MKSSSALKLAQRLDIAPKAIVLKSEKISRSLDGQSRQSQNPRRIKRKIITMSAEHAELMVAIVMMKSTNRVVVVVIEKETSALAIPSLSMVVIVEGATTVIQAMSTSKERHERNSAMTNLVTDGILLRVLRLVLELLSYCAITARRKGKMKAAVVVV